MYCYFYTTDETIVSVAYNVIKPAFAGLNLREKPLRQFSFRSCEDKAPHHPREELLLAVSDKLMRVRFAAGTETVQSKFAKGGAKVGGFHDAFLSFVCFVSRTSLYT